MVRIPQPTSWSISNLFKCQQEASSRDFAGWHARSVRLLGLLTDINIQNWECIHWYQFWSKSQTVSWEETKPSFSFSTTLKSYLHAALHWRVLEGEALRVGLKASPRKPGGRNKLEASLTKPGEVSQDCLPCGSHKVTSSHRHTRSNGLLIATEEWAAHE